MFKINLKAIFKSFIKINGVLFAIMGFVAVFIDLSSYFTHWYNALLCIFIILALVFIISLHILFANKKTVFCNINQKEIIVAYGDLFTDTTEIKVIAVNRCFDTEVDDELISINSLHGQWIQKQLHHISVNNLKEQIDSSLKNQGCVGKEIANKSKGSKIRYPVGTIAEVRDGETRYFLVALTEMDEQLNSSCTLDDYCLALSRLMYFFDKKGQGYDMAMPIMGAGLARLNKGEKELLDLIITLIKIHQNEMRGSIKVIVHKELKSKLSIAGL